MHINLNHTATYCPVLSHPLGACADDRIWLFRRWTAVRQIAGFCSSQISSSGQLSREESLQCPLYLAVGGELWRTDDSDHVRDTQQFGKRLAFIPLCSCPDRGVHTVRCSEQCVYSSWTMEGLTTKDTHSNSVRCWVLQQLALPFCGTVQTEESAMSVALSCDLWLLYLIFWAAVQAGESVMSIIVNTGLTTLAVHWSRPWGRRTVVGKVLSFAAGTYIRCAGIDPMQHWWLSWIHPWNSVTQSHTLNTEYRVFPLMLILSASLGSTWHDPEDRQYIHAPSRGG
jgi:hypothetical protein